MRRYGQVCSRATTFVNRLALVGINNLQALAVCENGWAVLDQLKQELPMLADAELAGRIEHAVQAAFSPGSAR